MNNTAQNPVLFVTSAPPDYDFSTTVQLNTIEQEYTRTTLRLVLIPSEQLAKQQQLRYQSGLYASIDEPNADALFGAGTRARLGANQPETQPEVLFVAIAPDDNPWEKAVEMYKRVTDGWVYMVEIEDTLPTEVVLAMSRVPVTTEYARHVLNKILTKS